MIVEGGEDGGRADVRGHCGCGMEMVFRAHRGKIMIEFGFRVV